MCLEEEEKLIMEIGVSTMLATTNSKEKFGISQSSISKVNGKGTSQVDIKKVHKLILLYKKKKKEMREKRLCQV